MHPTFFQLFQRLLFLVSFFLFLHFCLKGFFFFQPPTSTLRFLSFVFSFFCPSISLFVFSHSSLSCVFIFVFSSRVFAFLFSFSIALFSLLLFSAFRFLLRVCSSPAFVRLVFVAFNLVPHLFVSLLSSWHFCSFASSSPLVVLASCAAGWCKPYAVIEPNENLSSCPQLPNSTLSLTPIS